MNDEIAAMDAAETAIIDIGARAVADNRNRRRDRVAWLIYRANTDPDLSDDEARAFWDDEPDSYRGRIERLAQTIVDELDGNR